MSYNSELQSNNIDLQGILDIINALPEAGGGSIDDFFPTGSFSYTVDAISGASYGFALNEAGYYESQNKAFPSTYAICRVNFNVKQTCDIVFDVINFAEPGYDYGLLGNLDVSLGLNIGEDSNVKKSFKNASDHSASVVNVTYAGVTPGSHFVDVKFIKDNSTNRDNDSIQFKVQSAIVSLPQETIDRILQADADLISSNIRSGVDIFGVVGSLTAGSSPILQEKTVTSSTSTQIVQPDSGYDALSKVTVNPIAVAELQLPSMSANADGNVYATAQQTEGGYIAAGSRVTNTLKLSSAHDSDFVASNIKNGVTIFGLTGTYSGSGGIDTSDATATAEDLVEGKTAYVNGQKITGIVYAYDNQVGWNNISPTLSGSNLRLSINPGFPYLFRNGYYLSTPLSNLGDATAADVASGKTFTSSSGLKVTGTYSGSTSSGSLPAGISKITTGSYTPTSDESSSRTITHGLGVAPDAVAFFADGTVDSSDFAGYLAWEMYVMQPFTQSGTTNVGYYYRRYGSTSGTSFSAGGATATSSVCGTSTFMVHSNSSSKLKAGVKYKWVAVKLS